MMPAGVNILLVFMDKLSLNGRSNRSLRPKSPRHSEGVLELLAQKKLLSERIQMIENRLLFGSMSQPLQDHCQSLKQQDMLLACKLTELLTSGNRA